MNGQNYFFANQVRFPSPTPLLRIRGEWQLRPEDHHETGSRHLMIHNMGDHVWVEPSSALLPTSWLLEYRPGDHLAPYTIREGVGNSAFSGQRDTVTYGPVELSYSGMNQVGIGPKSFRVGFSLKQRKSENYVTCSWTFDDGRPISPDHGALWIIQQWGALKRRVERGRTFFTANVSHLLDEERKSILKTIKRLTGIPLGRPIWRGEEPLDGPELLDLDLYENCVRAVLPPEFHELMNNPSLLPEIVYTERYAIETVLKDGELTSAKLSLYNEHDISQRPSRGLGFLRNNLGFKPNVARHSTNKKQIEYPLKLGRSTYQLSGMTKEYAMIGSALVDYAELIKPGITTLRRHLGAFLSSRVETAELGPPA